MLCLTTMGDVSSTFHSDGVPPQSVLKLNPKATEVCPLLGSQSCGLSILLGGLKVEGSALLSPIPSSCQKSVHLQKIQQRGAILKTETQPS